MICYQHTAVFLPKRCCISISVSISAFQYRILPFLASASLHLCAADHQFYHFLHLFIFLNNSSFFFVFLASELSLSPPETRCSICFIFSVKNSADFSDLLFFPPRLSCGNLARHLPLSFPHLVFAPSCSFVCSISPFFLCFSATSIAITTSVSFSHLPRPSIHLSMWISFVSLCLFLCLSLFLSLPSWNQPPFISYFT